MDNLNLILPAFLLLIMSLTALICFWPRRNDAEPDHSIPYDGCYCGDPFCGGCGCDDENA